MVNTPQIVAQNTDSERGANHSRSVRLLSPVTHLSRIIYPATTISRCSLVIAVPPPPTPFLVLLLAPCFPFPFFLFPEDSSSFTALAPPETLSPSPPPPPPPAFAPPPACVPAADAPAADAAPAPSLSSVLTLGCARARFLPRAPVLPLPAVVTVSEIEEGMRNKKTIFCEGITNKAGLLRRKACVLSKTDGGVLPSKC